MEGLATPCLIDCAIFHEELISEDHNGPVDIIYRYDSHQASEKPTMVLWVLTNRGQ